MRAGLRCSVATGLFVVLTIQAAAQEQAAASRVRLLATPDGGLQPRAAVDSNGVVQLVYFQGEPRAGDLRYVRSTDGGRTFSPPVPVNHVPGGAIATGNIRGAQLALGRNDRLHVVWNGSGPRPAADKSATKAGTDAAPGPTPLYYTHLAASGGDFLPERDLSEGRAGLDGGSAVAADDQGQVFVVWHRPGEHGHDEGARQVVVARSRDDGDTFGKAIVASSPDSGVCPCCGLGAAATRDGGLAILYRMARNQDDRSTVLLTSRDGSKFTPRVLDPWRVSQCVMSSFALAPGATDVFGAWETEGQVRFCNLADPKNPLAPPGLAGRRRLPSIARNAAGEVLLAWTEGVSWGQGGAVAWQLFDASGKVVAGNSGRAAGVPAWSIVQAVALADGSFVVLH